MKLTFPPVITLACLGMQFLLYLMLPLEVNLSLLFGLILLIGSVALIVMAFKELKNYETTYIPDGEPEKLVNTGPFKISRNPIYLGMSGILISAAFLMQSISALLIPILFLSIIQNTWIPHEEEKLKEKFPEEWKEYTAATKRWLW
jgi:protein-S-isoprenylcysteine O-methyltransferase Ste14